MLTDQRKSGLSTQAPGAVISILSPISSTDSSLSFLLIICSIAVLCISTAAVVFSLNKDRLTLPGACGSFVQLKLSQ